MADNETRKTLTLSNNQTAGFMEPEIRANWNIVEILYQKYLKDWQWCSDKIWTIEYFEERLWYDDAMQHVFIKTKEEKKAYKKLLAAEDKVARRAWKDALKKEKKGEVTILC